MALKRIPRPVASDLQASLHLALHGSSLGGPRRMRLLAEIGGTGSIRKAAQAAGLSYKGAWDAVQAMNNLAAEPLVEKAVGGKGGGGARLTARAEQLLRQYTQLEQEHTAVLSRLNNESAGQDLRVLGRLLMNTSARNQFAGRVRRITRGAVNDEVELEIAGGARICAVITRESTRALGLKKGSDAVALVKASWILLAAGDIAEMKLSARNQLRGTVGAITRGAVNSEVVLEIPGGASVVAVVTNASVKSLGLKTGSTALALFKASSVILGVTA